MSEMEIASTQLIKMINDVDAHALFEKSGSLAFFSLQKTYTYALVKGQLTDKQVKLIASVYDRYLRLKAVRARHEITLSSLGTSGSDDVVPFSVEVVPCDVYLIELFVGDFDPLWIGAIVDFRMYRKPLLGSG
jgi:hypothetical protein